jgi:5-hydroxyisourate hydrolase
VSGLSTHVLDTARGRPAAGVAVTLARRESGRLARAVPRRHRRRRPGALAAAGGRDSGGGEYRVTFALADWFAGADREAFYPEAAIVFTVTRPEEHHHVPLLLAPFGYSTYRGS